MAERRGAWDAWEQLIRSADPDPLDVIRLAGTYQRYLFEIQDKAVRAARSQGRTWQEIGEAVGTTRQAAWQRFKVAPATPSPEAIKAMLDRPGPSGRARPDHP
jgi:hypothetical protein